ncbi:MAG TPA: DNA translocase FtsK [Flavobacterium sp.]|nr:DNA translocase FtsK [Flavobacterium sp.]
MAKKVKKETKSPGNQIEKKPFWNPRNKMFVGAIFVLFSVALLLSFASYYIYGAADQSTLSDFVDRSEKANNWLGKFGAFLGNLFLYQGFGAASFLFVRLFFITGTYLILDLSISKLKKTWFWDLFAIVVLSVLLGFFHEQLPELGGVVGFEINAYLQDFIGKAGTILVLVLGIVIYLIFKIRISPDAIRAFVKKHKKEVSEDMQQAVDQQKEAELKAQAIHSSEVSDLNPKPIEREDEDFGELTLKTVAEPKQQKIDEDAPTISNPSTIQLSTEIPPKVKEVEKPVSTIESTDDFVVEMFEEDTIEVNAARKLVEDFGEFDPTLDLSKYQFPTIDLLKDYKTSGITINQEELEANKNRIVDTLKNYKIEIAQIKATVGPTVTLYEIVPEAGVRISKIKNLEDDIALSLSALGIRIIAPIPGKGTIGIEVPNQNPAIVPMRSVISSAKFQNAEMELPIALGKTISNETFVVDLAKMPHMLMAGATGQGKSVGLNAVLTSLLYKKHPAEVKFVLVDPKKVELTLFNKIERHYLAKLPDSGEAIITDNTKVIHTLNSLCIEMDNRYELLKDASVRNIKEYNVKFKNRSLNPELGHRFLPYIVLVVDEFADLIMTAGKEVETPIARLAQLARAIGIHLIIATQRPSVNVITGIIKANFPARIAFRVTSKIDSRTILDSQGADQLIGRGDMLYTQGNDLTRVQCAFVDTPEVEKICEFIGNQKGYSDAYLLPEYVGEESGISLDNNISDRDPLFKDAAEVVITAQQGSTSLIQRKLKLGYNRAGRLIDQLEAAGIVGQFEGSKARAVLIPDLAALEIFLNNEQNSH